LAGKTVIVSFWAFSPTPVPKLGISIDQIFGTGGTPSANVLQNGTAVTLTTGFALYSVVLTLPSVAGMTLGTNGDHCSNLNIWFSSGLTNTSRAGHIGAQSGQVGLWGVQLEIGSVATPLEKLDPRLDLANAQRFFQTGWVGWNGYGAAGQTIGSSVMFPVTMRASPTVTIGVPGYNNASAATPQNTSVSGTQIVATTGSTGNAAFNSTFTASADL
jgi:hypothetical protein